MAVAKAVATKDPLIVEFVIEKETKNTVKFAEVGESFTHKIGALYIQKQALAELRSNEGAWPKHVVVSIVAQ